MSFDTSKRKLSAIWQENNLHAVNLEQAILKQGKKETIIQLSQPNMTDFGVLRRADSGWIPMEAKSTDNTAEATLHNSFSISLVLPESYVPFARMETAYQRTDEENVFGVLNDFSFWSIFTYFTKFSVIEDITIPNFTHLKKVTWYVGLTTKKLSVPRELPDFLVKFYFVIVRPT